MQKRIQRKSRVYNLALLEGEYSVSRAKVRTTIISLVIVKMVYLCPKNVKTLQSQIPKACIQQSRNKSSVCRFLVFFILLRPKERCPVIWAGEKQCNVVPAGLLPSSIHCSLIELARPVPCVRKVWHYAVHADPIFIS